jgi:urease accessory protein
MRPAPIRLATALANTFATAALAALPLVAAAHTGADAGAHHGLGFMAGLAHPFTGLDHLFAMLAVGVWSALAMRGSLRWVAPIAFAGMLLVGALLGLAGVALPAVEPMIAASLLALGLLLAVRQSLPAVAAAAVAGAFALFHGVAHGAELAGAASPVLALAGMLLGTLALHGIGLGLGQLLIQRSQWLPRAAGFGVAAFGAVLLTRLA